MNFIELTSYIGDPQGYADEPYFDSQLWPLILTNRAEIEKVFLFSHHSSKVSANSFANHKLVSPNIADIGPMARLPSERLKNIAYWSFFGGHLSVLYQIRSESSLLIQLFGLYPQPGKLIDDTIDTLGLDDGPRFELATLVELVHNRIIASFAHDADPLYIFGHHETLTSILQVISERYY